MSIASRYPTIRPSLNLDFANSATVDPRITFTRASTATYYDGKTTAKAEENLLTYSQDFNNSIWTYASGATKGASVTDPLGTTTGISVTYPLSSAGSLYHAVSVADGIYTISVYARSATAKKFRLVFYAGPQQRSADITTTSAWTRYSFTSTSLSSLAYVGFENETAGGVGDVEFWGAQLEQRSSVTAYTPTTTAPITNYIPVLQTAASGVPRLDYDPVTSEAKGLLIEEQRTNLLTYSSEFDNAAWGKTNETVTANTNIAPDGTLTADTITSNSASSGTNTVQSVSGFSAGATVAFSIYLKRTNNDWVIVAVSRAGATTYGEFGAWFNLATGVVGSTFSAGTNTFVSKSITSVGNGWYRCMVVGSVASATAYTAYTSIASANAATTSIVGASRYIWGAQLEAGSFATSYIPTTSAQVTRAADSASMTGTNFSSWYNQNEGSVYTQASTFMDISSINNRNDTVNISDGTANNVYFFGVNSVGSTNSIYLYSASSNVAQAAITRTLTSGSYKGAYGYKVNDFVAVLDGGGVGTDTLGNVSSGVDRLNIGSRFGTSQFQNGHIKRIAYYPKRLTNTELQALTA